MSTPFESILSLYTAINEAAEAIALYQSEQDYLKQNDTGSSKSISDGAKASYIRLYYLAAPMIEQVTKFKEGCLEGLPDPSETELELQHIPQHFRKLSQLIYKHNIVTVEGVNQLINKIMDREV